MPSHWHLGLAGLRRPWEERARAGADEPIVGLIDSGVDPSHCALANYRAAPSRLHFRRADDGGALTASAPVDLQAGHGTTAAALIGGLEIGVAPGVPLAVVAAMPSAYFPADADGAGRLAAIEAAYAWLVGAEHVPGRVGVDVVCVNVSVSGPYEGFLDAAAAHARAHGILTIAPTGNTARMGGPASLDAVLAVGWHDECGRVLPGSSGVRPGAAGRRAKPELIAPGANLPRCNPAYPERFARADGSSYAAPLAAGAVAWLMRHEPGLRRAPGRVERRLRDLGEPFRLADGTVTRRLRLSPGATPRPLETSEATP